MDQIENEMKQKKKEKRYVSKTIGTNWGHRKSWVSNFHLPWYQFYIAEVIYA